MTTAGQPAATINVTDVLETSPNGGLQIRVFTLSMLCLMVEQAYGPLPGYSLAPHAGELQLSP